MEIPKIHESEYRFCLIMWEHEPITAAELVKLCQEQLDWKRTTTYTVLKKLSDRDIVRNLDSTVIALVKREQVQQYESEAVVDRAFGGSLPAFVAAFTSGRELSQEDVDEIQTLIDQYREKQK